MEQTLWGIIVNAVDKSGAVEKAVLLLLLALSILSWALILLKAKIIRKTQADNARFLDVFEKAAHTGEALEEGGQYVHSSMFVVFRDGMEMFRNEKAAAVKPVVPGGDNLPLKSGAGILEKVQQRMQHASKNEYARMFWGMDTLASIGSASPFIGLLGTVWGIMGTFQALAGAKSASLQVVAPGIASALIATAAGLAVAIPAVAAYNWIMARMDEIQENVGCFIERATLLLQTGGGLDATSRHAKK